MNVLVSGSLAYDRIMDFPGKFIDHILPDKIHKLNVSFGLEKLTVNYGGTSGNIAYTLALLGERPQVISQVGTDFADYRRWLQRYHIRTNTIRIVPSEVCATAHIITDLSDNQIAGFHFGAMKQQALADSNIKHTIQRLITNETIGILGAGNLDDMIELAQLYARKSLRYIVDPGQQLVWLTPVQLRTLLVKAHTLIVNDYELDLVLKKLKVTAQKLKQQLPQLIVTLGNKGAVWYVHGRRYHLPIAKPKRVVDPTGAGDAYRSGVILGMLYNWEPAVAGRVAALCATYAIEQYGTQNHHFTVSSFRQRFYKIFKRKLTF